MKKSFIFLWSLLLLSSCDSREDWFEKNSGVPDLVYTIDGVSDTIREGEERVIPVKVSLHLKNEDLFSDTFSIDFSALNKNGIFPIDFVNPNEANQSSSHDDFNVCTLFPESSNVKGFMTGDIRDLEVDPFSNGLETQYLGPYYHSITIYDVFRNEVYYNLEITIVKLDPPIPVLECSQIRDMEYLLSMKKSSDRDGHITKYEWCIDGNIVKYNLTDNPFETIEGGWNSGKSAYGGTYITATELNSINHSFQEKGEHIVHYRCMDNSGIWSPWFSQSINIE